MKGRNPTVREGANEADETVVGFRTLNFGPLTSDLGRLCLKNQDSNLLLFTPGFSPVSGVPTNQETVSTVSPSAQLT